MDSKPTIIVYGADWCEDTIASRAVLDRLGYSYRYVDVDHDEPGEALIQSKNNGKRQTPTIDINGKFLIEPSDEELTRVLGEIGKS